MEPSVPLDRLKELYQPPPGRFVRVDVPEMRFFAIDGGGDPQAAPFRQAMQRLFAVVFPFRRMARERMGSRFVEPPVEALIWADDMRDLRLGVRERWQWRLMVVAPEWATGEMLREASAEADRKLGASADVTRFVRCDEGDSVQTMHVGPYEGIAATAARLHDEYLPAHGLVARGAHHEIYLNDASRTAPEKRKVVLRQPVCAESEAATRRT